ncbi:helix-turn-helix transcriptional regulator [Mycobacterium aquaticum]|uniref:Transcriptional regulator n=1 Tax=Mycobacterium aquaticum TaxID=1927124 RepID=A0A1X0AV97_9MYCO|nr:helix-turn-helix transcriptional regulator [Mycobacterium aquaticum]ORA33970.1 transcriptional regulator [Mycobacterium aquaticum]
MDPRKDIREFLTTRRARITPQQAGIPDYGAKRRVPGLRREEVALLAGVSVDYYTRLERGNLTGVSDTVLGAVAKVLELDEAERAHLWDLVRASTTIRKTQPKPTTAQIRPNLQHVLDALVGAPAWVSNDRLDILATNRLCEALYADAFAGPQRPVNLARYIFLEPKSRQFFLDWEQHADNAVDILRTSAGRNPYEEQLTKLVGELSTRSDDFRTRWGAHNVRFHRTGVKRMHHADVGDLDLTFEGMEVSSHPGLTLYVMTAEPGSASDERLRILASWASPTENAPRGARVLPPEQG